MSAAKKIKVAGYQWRDGARISPKIDPQAAGERMADLKKKGGGFLTPDAVVDDARSKSSPLHEAFIWDDADAADKHRLETARLLIRSIRVVVILEKDNSTVEEHRRVYVHIQPGEDDDSDPAYVSVDTLASRDDFRNQVLGDAMAQLRAFRARYAELSELGGVMQEIDKVLKTSEPKTMIGRAIRSDGPRKTGGRSARVSAKSKLGMEEKGKKF